MTVASPSSSGTSPRRGSTRSYSLSSASSSSAEETDSESTTASGSEENTSWNSSRGDCEDKYGPDGFYKLHVGEVLAGRFRVDSKLGQGHFATVWGCKDLQAGGRAVAVKILKSAERYKSVAEHEVSLLSAASKHAARIDAEGSSGCDSGTDDGTDGGIEAGSAREEHTSPSPHVLRLLDRFELVAPKSGRHPCLVFERLGPNLLQLARRCPRRQFPIDLTRLVAKDILVGLDFLHRHCGIVHTDLKPENILLRFEIDAAGCSADDDSFHESVAKRPRLSPPANGSFASGDLKEKGLAAAALSSDCCGKQERRALLEAVRKSFEIESGGKDMCGLRVSFCLADFGNGCFVNALRSGRGTCQYKSPEVLLGAGYDGSADLWSLGCMLFECASGGYLFDPRFVRKRRRAAVGASEDGCLPDDVPRDEEHLAQICELLGALPDSLTRRGSKIKDLIRRGSPGPQGERGRWLLRRTGLLLDSRPRHGGLFGRFRRRAMTRTRAGGCARADVDALAGFAAEMLQTEPLDRPSARDLLRRPFLRPRSEAPTN